MRSNAILISKSKIYLIAITFLLLGLSLNSFSHQRSESYSKWTIEKENKENLISIIFSIRLSNLNKLEGPLRGDWENKVSKIIISSFEFDANCSVSSKPRTVISRQNDIFKLHWTLLCLEEIKKINVNIFFNKDPTHSHIARYTYSSDLSTEKLFSAQSRSWYFNENTNSEESSTNSFLDYVLLGIKHISTGYDHLAFLFGLLLLNPRMKRLILAITGFTIGHSITLSLAVMELVRPVSAFIEALIGFSIAILGLEYLIRNQPNKLTYMRSTFLFLFLFLLAYIFYFDGSNITGLLGLLIFSFCYLTLISGRHSWFLSLFLACAFGLIHGFGFGGFLFEVGLSEENLLKALFGFNLGVELGQLLAIGIFLTFLYFITKFKIKTQEYINPVLAIILVTIGTYWFVYRVI